MPPLYANTSNDGLVEPLGEFSWPAIRDQKTATFTSNFWSRASIALCRPGIYLMVVAAKLQHGNWGSCKKFLPRSVSVSRLM